VESYVKQVASADVVLLPKVGHGFSVQKNWLPQFREAFTRLVRDDQPAGKVKGPVTGVDDLPLVEVAAQGPSSDLLAVILTGDGGWASLDRDIGTSLAARGVAVVGLNTLQYFWTSRSPELAGKDLERIMRHYQAAWQRQKIILIGYSLGADVLPFMASRLPDDLRQQVALLALLGPGKTASFEFHLSDWLGGNSPAGQPVAPELDKMQGMKVLCLYGEEEQDSLCRGFAPQGPQFKAISLGGGHHFGGDYAKLTDLIYAAAMGR
jgi:type IV secretory pathway VirJ component